MGECITKLRVSGWAGLTYVDRKLERLCVLALAGGLWWGAGAAPVQEARNLTTDTYAADGLSKIATLKVGRVFTENRRVGFFRVKLLPVLVVQDVRLELSAVAAGENWPASFQADLTPLFRRRSSGIEWRDLSIWLPGDTAPRLQAQRGCPSANAETALISTMIFSKQTKSAL